MRSLGLDLSSASTGWAIISDGPSLVDYGAIAFDAHTAHKDRLIILGGLIEQITTQFFPIDWVIIEDTFMAKNVKTTKLLNKYSGVAIASVRKSLFDSTKIAIAYPSSIRAALFPKQKGIKAEQSKEDVFNYMCDKYNLPPDSVNDITDAIALATFPFISEVDKTWIL